jgi:hypothetical protein
MAHSTNKPTRSLAALALPVRSHALIAYATAVVDGMAGNPLFPTPTLPLATVSAASPLPANWSGRSSQCSDFSPGSFRVTENRFGSAGRPASADHRAV